MVNTRENVDSQALEKIKELALRVGQNYQSTKQKHKQDIENLHQFINAEKDPGKIIERLHYEIALRYNNWKHEWHRFLRKKHNEGKSFAEFIASLNVPSQLHKHTYIRDLAEALYQIQNKYPNYTG